MGVVYLPEPLPDAANARLPDSYEHAKRALAACVAIDECKQWADKAAALASYAKQQNDDTLFNEATRIKARAIRRVGELLREIEPAQGANQNIREAALPNVGRAAAATDAGLSEHQRKTALRVANVPEQDFEREVESDTPPTLEALAEQGTKKLGPDHLGRRTADEFAAATRLMGLINSALRLGPAINLISAIRGMKDYEQTETLSQIAALQSWLCDLEVELRACQ
jgi:hypothetical protein